MNTKKLIPAALALSALATFAAENASAPLTMEQILAVPRRATVKTPMPKDGSGVYIGSGVYPCTGRLMGTGLCFTYWEPKHPDFDETIELCAKEKVGNCLQFWRGGNQGCDLARKARAKGICSVFLYGKPGDTAEDSKKFVAEMGDDYLGYDFGERFSMDLKERKYAAGEKKPDLQTLADKYMWNVHDFVNKMHEKGLGNVQATSANAGLDFEVAAGAEVPCTEDFPFGDLNLSSALSRGLYRQWNLPMWGSHLAHEWYSWIPHTCPYKMTTLKTAFQLKYMAGSKMIINESGNWQLQSGLCPDSPMSKMPILRGNPVGMYGPKDPRSGFNAEVMKEAEKKFSYIDCRSPVATKYRRIISEFYDFCVKNPCPKGQPEATVAMAKGNLDLGGMRYIAGYVVGNALALAREDISWYHGHPELSWEVALKQLLPRPPMLAPDYNLHFSGTPFGQIDIASFACDAMTAEHLLKNYKVLMFAGWNTCSEKQYKVLCDYVNGGGILVLGVCHLSTDKKRNYMNFTLDDIVNKGDLTDLCNMKLKGPGRRFYWATGPEHGKKNKVGFIARRRWGYMGGPLADFEYTGKPEDYENLAIDDEGEAPVVVEIKKGKGKVIMLTAWCYPSMVNQDYGTGARVEQRGMMGEIYRYAAKLGRGNVWITGPDFENPDENCDWISFSYFPEGGKICLLNMDYENERKCVLHWFGEKDFITLAPGEFRLMDAPVLDMSEMLNSDGAPSR